MTSWSRLALVLVTSSATALAAPTLSGVYSVGGVGLVEFSVEDGTNVGRYRVGGECHFDAQHPVVKGAFEGNVFIGSVLLCQEGPGCPATQSFPFLGFWHADQLIGWVRFESGCSSRATDERRLLFRQATADEKRALGSTSSATDVARKRAGNPADSAMEEIKKGESALSAGAYAQAARHFEAALDYDADNFVGHFGLGSCQVKLRQPSAAVSSLLKALRLGKAAGAANGFLAQVHYNLACAHAQLEDRRSALKALGEAARLGESELLDELEHDPDLESLRGDAEFRRAAAVLRVKGKR